MIWSLRSSLLLSSPRRGRLLNFRPTQKPAAARGSEGRVKYDRFWGGGSDVNIMSGGVGGAREMCARGEGKSTQLSDHAVLR